LCQIVSKYVLDKRNPYDIIMPTLRQPSLKGYFLISNPKGLNKEKGIKGRAVLRKDSLKDGGHTSL
jgi:hypothetical protein